MKRLLPLVLCLAITGCANRDVLPYLGQWHGGLVVDKIASGGTDRDRKREELQGFLQIYATNRTFKMHLEGEQEAIDANGEWSHVGPTLTLKFNSVKIDDEGGAAVRDPNRKFIAAEDVRRSYQRNMILRMSADKKSLDGLEVTVGQLTGHHVFSRLKE